MAIAPVDPRGSACSIHGCGIGSSEAAIDIDGGPRDLPALLCLVDSLAGLRAMCHDGI
jgi:hypothetical protein